MFEAIYGSTWHHPVAFWVVGLPFLAFLAHRLKVARDRFALSLLTLFQLLILTDAWMTSSWSPFAEGSVAKTAVAVAFVIVGDLRYLVLLQRFGLPPEKARSPLQWLVLPLAASLLVPVASKLVTAPWADNPRVLFLVYELMFAALATGVLVWQLPRRPDARTPGWVRRLTQFEIAQYLLWAAADVVILSGYDVGYLLRLVPNVMYYAVFVPFAWWSAPKEVVS
ncbi:MAG TPA: hypothetical protein ENK57_01540 [Polyangiaceae bacterium]|nr:hypothetical protein [Polyangiaceae bacterium]